MKKSNYCKIVMIFFALTVMAGCAKILVLKEKACFNKAEKENRVESYAKYLKEYPSGIYKSEAMDRIEKITWEDIRRENRIESYANYLKEYPSGIYKSEAMDRIEDITWEEIRRKNQTPTKPKVDPSAKKSCYFGGPDGRSEICSQPTSDGGKLCTSSNECQGVCLSSGGGGREGRRIGKCSNITGVVSCQDFIEDGYLRTICVD